jgi:SAM-dependent methyltransferase
MSNPEFERLISEAEQQPFSGWNFSFIRDRWHEEGMPWDYAERVRARLPQVEALLDMGTGGGEVLSGLAPLPPRTAATEGYPPNVEIARARLAPLGVAVVPVQGAPDNVDIASGEGIGTLPFPDGSFPLVINRHESFYPAEVFRILREDGRFITQQVGGEHHRELCDLLFGETTYDPAWNPAFAVNQLREAGFRIVEEMEAFPTTDFHDIGAVVYYLKAVPWQVPDFTVEAYRDRLSALHRHIEMIGDLRVRGHIFYIEAVKL